LKVKYNVICILFIIREFDLGNIYREVFDMGEYMSQENRKPCEKKETGCNVYITVICGEKKKNEQYGKYNPCEQAEKDGKKEIGCDGCNVYITVICDGEKKDRD
jgi:hypothetical protein